MVDRVIKLIRSIEVMMIYLQRTKVLERLGLLSEGSLAKAGSPLDTLSNHLASTLAYDAGERDMILMRHEVKTKNKVIKIAQKPIMSFLRCCTNNTIFIR